MWPWALDEQGLGLLGGGMVGLAAFADLRFGAPEVMLRVMWTLRSRFGLRVNREEP